MLDETNTAVKSKMRDLREEETMLGGTEITVAEKFWWSWQMRQSLQLRRLLFPLVSEAGSEKVEPAMALFAATRLPCVCAASIVVP